jgi:hypothetical protein
MKITGNIVSKLKSLNQRPTLNQTNDILETFSIIAHNQIKNLIDKKILNEDYSVALL